MEVKPPSTGGCVEYMVEYTGENGEQRESGWVTAPRYTDRKLSPNSVNRYRVKARNRYLQETDWSTVQSVQTGDMPAPVIWRLTEGKGKNIADTGGRHTGRVQGRADWVTDRHGTSLRFDGPAFDAEYHPAVLHAVEKVLISSDKSTTGTSRQTDEELASRAGRESLIDAFACRSEVC